MFDLISIGNVSIDLYFKGEFLTFHDGRFQLAVGGKYFTDQFHTSVGGGGANVAIGASKNGLKSAVYGKIGNNSFKKIIVDELKSHKVSTKLCEIEEKYTNISCILLNPKGERSIVHYTSHHQHLLNSVDAMSRFKEAGMVYLGNLPDVSLTEREDLLHFLKGNSITSVVNLGINDCRRPKSQLETFLKPVDILIINGHEFAELVKAPYKDIHFKSDVVNWYIPYLKNKLVIITEGEKGSYSYLKGRSNHQDAIKPDYIVDTTGAGDGYTAAFISELLKSKDIAKSMEKGAQYAEKILAKVGAN